MKINEQPRGGSYEAALTQDQRISPENGAGSSRRFDRTTDDPRLPPVERPGPQHLIGLPAAVAARGATPLRRAPRQNGQ